MKLDRARLEDAAKRGVISHEQVDPLWSFLSEAGTDSPTFRLTHILYYLGGLIAIGAMTLFMTLGWERFGGWGLLLIALAYAVGGLWLTHYLLYRQALPIPAGIAAAFVVVLTPLAIYGLQVGLGFWADDRPYRAYHTHVEWRWLLMELATLAVAAIMLWRYRLPFLVMPVAVTLWYLSMDLTPFLFGQADTTWELRKFVSLWFGLLMVLLAFWVDVRARHGQDFAFWLYLFGVVTFWSGLSLMQSDSELSKFMYLCINLLLIGLGSVLYRRVFVVFGGLGAAGYLAYLAHNVFRESMLFPFVLSAIGLAIIYLGIVWQRNEHAISQRMQGLLPAALRELLERRS